MEIKEKKPFEYTRLGQFIKKIGFNLGFKGINRVELIHTRNGKVLNKSFSYNSRVNKGADLIASLITGVSQNSIVTPLPPKYIALSTSVLTPAYTDTTLTGETSVSGLARALGTQQNYSTPVALDGSASYVVTKTFTLLGGATTVASAALFDAASTGNMFVEANLTTPLSMATNDTIQINWTIQL